MTELGDMQQNVALRTDDIIFVPRSFIGDINEVIQKAGPLLRILLLPATYRDLYSTGGGTVFTRPLPGTSAKPVAGEGEGEEGSEGDEGDE